MSRFAAFPEPQKRQPLPLERAGLREKPTPENF
jgi:hypothetical protein